MELEGVSNTTITIIIIMIIITMISLSLTRLAIKGAGTSQSYLLSYVMWGYNMIGSYVINDKYYYHDVLDSECFMILSLCRGSSCEIHDQHQLI